MEPPTVTLRNSPLIMPFFSSSFFAFWLWDSQPVYPRVIEVTVGDSKPPTAPCHAACSSAVATCRGQSALSRWPVNGKLVHQLWKKKNKTNVQWATVALWLPEAVWWQEWVMLQPMTEGSPASERHSGTSSAFGAGHKKLIILCYSFTSVTFHPRVCFLQKTSYIHQKWQNTDLM